MNKVFIVLLLLLKSGYAIELNEIPRFYRAMEQFDFPEYKFGTGGISLLFKYDEGLNKSSERPDPNIPSYVKLNQFYHQQFNGDGSANYQIKKLSPENLLTNDLRFVFSGSLNETSVLSADDTYGYYDTSSNNQNDANLNLRDDFEIEKHFNFKKSGQNPFVKLDVAISGSYSDSRGHQYNSHSLRYSYYNANYSKTKKYSSLLNVIPSIGIGKRKPIYPIYQSFEIERKLKQSGTLKGKLSDLTIQSLATVIVSQDKINAKHTQPSKYIAGVIDSVLRNDSNVNISKLDGFVYGKIKEAENCFGQFDYGIRSGIELTNDYYCIVNYFRIESKDAPDSSKKKYHKPDRLNFFSECTTPLYKRFFVEYKISIPIFQKSGFTALDSGSFHLGLMWFTTDKLFCSAGINSLPLKNLVPSGDRPGSINAELRYFLEDRLSVNLLYSNNYSKSRYSALPGSEMYNQNYLSCGVTYVY